MKNILITSTTRENQGTSFSFVKDINDIVNEEAREMIINYIEKTDWKSGGYWSYEGIVCGSDMGYIFNDYSVTDNMFPLIVEHIVDYILE